MSNTDKVTTNSVVWPCGNPDQVAKLKKINEDNAVFYAERTRKLQEQLNETTMKIALHQRESEAARGIPINYWSFDRAIDDAVKATTLIRAEQARMAGRRKKTDPLQHIILQAVRETPEITEPQLLENLRAIPSRDVIQDIDDESASKPAIHFCQNGRIKSAHISGLKDRLTRAKRVIRKELAQTR